LNIWIEGNTIDPEKIDERQQIQHLHIVNQDWSGCEVRRPGEMSRVLYIEDEPNNRLLVRRILLVEGLDVDEADNALDGIQMARNNPPDLILMDISMPGMDGLTAAREMRQIPNIAHIPIVALTANAMEGDKERTLQAGCDGYISKPIDVDSFADEVFSYLR
jgi:two-component system, cell cycle response regulator DivK